MHINININKNTFFSVLTILFLGGLVYANTLNVPFYFDDATNIKNQSLRMEQASVDEIVTAVTSGTLAKRPVSNLSFAVNYFIGGYRVQGYHLVNISIHMLAGVCLFFLLRLTLELPVNKQKYGSYPNLALLATLIWVAHPLATQSVTYLVQRMNSMAAMFYVFSLLLYVLGRNQQQNPKKRSAKLPAWSLFCASGVSGLLALGSKEIAATLPMVIFLYEWYFFQDLQWNWVRKKIYLLMGGFGAFVALAFYYLGKMPWQVFFSECPTRDFTAYERLLTQFRVVITYISLLFYPNPNRLALDYDFPFSTALFTPVSTFYSLVVLLGLMLLAVFLARRERLLSFCILWFFVTLVIESSVICLEIIFEHRTYLPAMFFVLLVIAVLYRTVLNRKIVTVVSTLSIILLGYWTFERNRVWNDKVTFWESNILVYPDKARLHNNLGVALKSAGKTDRAEEEYNMSMALDPKAAIPRFNMAKLYIKQAKIEEAENLLREALKYKPDMTVALYKLAVILQGNEEYEKSIILFRAALEIEPKNSLIKKHLGNALLRNGHPEKALPYLQTVRLDRPKDKEVLLDIAESLTNTGLSKEAITVYQELLLLDPNQVQANYNIAVLFQQKGAIAEAITHYQRADKVSKDPQTLLYNYGNQLFKIEDYDEAERIYRKFLGISPIVADTYNNYGLLLLVQGRLEEAVHCFSIAGVLNPSHQLAQNNLRMATEQLNTERQKAKIKTKENARE